jgi:hypothetical protein
MRKIILMSLLAAMANVQAGPVGYFKTGNDFLALRENAKIAYVMGVIDGISSTYPTSPGIFCLPPSVTVGQAMAVFEKHLNDHPEERHEGAATLIAFSLHEAFRCNK